MTKTEENALHSAIKKDILKELGDMVVAEVTKQFKARQTEQQMKEISTKVLLNLFKTLTNRSSLWA